MLGRSRIGIHEWNGFQCIFASGVLSRVDLGWMQEMAGTVGPPLPCTAFRLEAVPEMNYDPGAHFAPHIIEGMWELPEPHTLNPEERKTKSVNVSMCHGMRNIGPLFCLGEAQECSGVIS